MKVVIIEFTDSYSLSHFVDYNVTRENVINIFMRGDLYVLACWQ